MISAYSWRIHDPQVKAPDLNQNIYKISKVDDLRYRRRFPFIFGLPQVSPCCLYYLFVYKNLKFKIFGVASCWPILLIFFVCLQTQQFYLGQWGKTKFHFGSLACQLYLSGCINFSSLWELNEGGSPPSFFRAFSSTWQSLSALLHSRIWQSSG